MPLKQVICKNHELDVRIASGNCRQICFVAAAVVDQLAAREDRRAAGIANRMTVDNRGHGLEHHRNIVEHRVLDEKADNEIIVVKLQVPAKLHSLRGAHRANPVRHNIRHPPYRGDLVVFTHIGVQQLVHKLVDNVAGNVDNIGHAQRHLNRKRRLNTRQELRIVVEEQLAIPALCIHQGRQDIGLRQVSMRDNNVRPGAGRQRHHKGVCRKIILTAPSKRVNPAREAVGLNPVVPATSDAEPNIGLRGNQVADNNPVDRASPRLRDRIESVIKVAAAHFFSVFIQ